MKIIRWFWTSYPIWNTLNNYLPLKFFILYEHIPKPVLIPKFIRVSELLSGSAARIIVSKPRFREVIIEFWDQLYMCLEVSLLGLYYTL